MNSPSRGRIGSVLAALALAFVVTACAAPMTRSEPAPVQEMSDARQAIQSARSVGSAKYTPQTLQEAERLLARATRDLNRGEYVSARVAALSAKRHAIVAREATLRVNSEPD